MSWASAVGSLFSSAANVYNANKAWQHQKEYAKNAHQWEVEDLKKAGLNPILSVGGSGAPMASAPMPEVDNPLSNWSATKMAKKTVEADVDNKESQTDANVANAKEATARADAIVQQTGQEKQLFDFKKEEAHWKVKTAQQNYINATKMPAVYDSQIHHYNTAGDKNIVDTRRGQAEMPFWQAAGEVVHSAVEYGKEAAKWVADKWKKGYTHTNDTSKNHRSGFVAHLDRGGTVANYK